MAVVDGLTKARMLAIEANSVVDGDVNASGNLVLYRHDGTLIDAGHVVGAPGVSITSSVIDENGDLIITYSSGAIVNVGRVTAPMNLAGAAPGDRLMFNGTEWVPDFGDSGWVNLSPATGFTEVEDMQVRRVGQVVQMHGVVERTAGGISDSGFRTFTTLPAEFRPNQILRVPSGMYATSSDSYARPGLYINPGGDIQCVRLGGVGSTHPQFQLNWTWLVD